VRFFVEHVVRYALRHKVLAAINILSVALGVAVYLAIQIANQSAISAFRASVDVVAGRANLETRGLMSDARFPELQKVTGVVAATPVVEGLVTLPDFPGEYLRILGVDPLTNSAFKNSKIEGLETDRANASAWFSDPAAVAVTSQFAQAYHLNQGDSLRIDVNGHQARLVLRFVLRQKDGESRFAVMDIGWAQELLHLQGKLTTVLFRISDPNNPGPVRDQLQRLLPPDVVVQAPEQRSEQVEQMLAGFQLNLTALSMVSLLVGVFLIYNTITASVMRRRSEIGILRALGASRQRIRSMFLAEAALYGAIGGIIGCAGGVLLANLLVRVVSKTVTNLYVLLSIEHFSFSVWQIPCVFVLGMVAALLGAFIPANAGANLPPLRALDLGVLIEQSQKPRPLWILLSGACLLLALVTAQLALNGYRPAGFACAFLTLAGFCCLSPHVTHWCGIWIGRIFKPVFLMRLASQNFVRASYRHAITVAALASALAMLVSISIMIYSFRKTIDRWVERRLVADLFISPAANEIIGFENFIPKELIQVASTRPEVEMIDTYRGLTVFLNQKPTSLGVIVGTDRNIPEYLGGKNAEKYKAFRRPDAVVISEPLSRRLRLREGDAVPIATPLGIRNFRVAGVFYDYTRDSGVMLMQRSNFERYWHDPRVNSLALYLRAGASVEAVIDAIRRSYARAQDYTFSSNRDLRHVVVEVFDQTFAVTQVLRVIAVFVAVIGIVLNLTVLVNERKREIGMLRAVGVARDQVRCLIVAESQLIGIASLFVGLIAGWALSLVLTEVINKAFFGWSIPLRLPWEQLLFTPIWLLPIAALASLLPASQATGANIIESIRMDT
jgi:putative ABC transport system permease protein